MAHPMVQVKPSRRQRDLSPVHPNAAAIDVGARMHVAAVGPDRDPEPVRTFNTFTDDLHRLADWFEQCGVKTVVMESTGVYWIPIYTRFPSFSWPSRLCSHEGGGVGEELSG